METKGHDLRELGSRFDSAHFICSSRLLFMKNMITGLFKRVITIAPEPIMVARATLNSCLCLRTLLAIYVISANAIFY